MIRETSFAIQVRNLKALKPTHSKSSKNWSLNLYDLLFVETQTGLSITLGAKYGLENQIWGVSWGYIKGIKKGRPPSLISFRIQRPCSRSLKPSIVSCNDDDDEVVLLSFRVGHYRQVIFISFFRF